MYTLSKVVGVKGVKFRKKKCAQKRLFHTEVAFFKVKVSIMRSLCKWKCILVAMILAACENTHDSKGSLRPRARK
jgi:hypothetical protein